MGKRSNRERIAALEAMERVRYENVDRRLNAFDALILRVARLEATSSERTGASSPVHDIVKWLGAAALLVLGWMGSKLIGK